MDTTSAKHIAVGGVVVAGTVTAIGQWAQGRNMPKLSVGIGTAIAGVGVAILAEWKPEIAAGIGILAGVSAAFLATDAMPGLQRAIERASR